MPGKNSRGILHAAHVATAASTDARARVARLKRAQAALRANTEQMLVDSATMNYSLLQLLRRTSA
jgi:hypothetical protein